MVLEETGARNDKGHVDHRAGIGVGGATGQG